MNGLVVYNSRYGAAKQYAVWLGKMLGLPVKNTAELQVWQLAAFDFIIAGSSIYMGKTLIKDWLAEHTKELEPKHMLFFIVGAAPPDQKDKTCKYATDNIPAALLHNNNYFYLQGKSVYSELGLLDKFFLKAGAWMAKNEQDKKAMLTDFNEVKRENLEALINKAKTYLV